MKKFNLTGWPGRIISAVLAVLCLAGTHFFMSQGLAQLTEARQLERLPVTPIAALAQGPYLVSGVAEASNGTLKTPYSGSQALYYEYKLTEEYRDSDGDLRTRVLESGQRGGAFRLTDTSGQSTVQPPAALNTVDWNIPRSYQSEQGKRTYTEWSLEPGDSVNVVGNFSRAGKNAAASTLTFQGLSDHHLPALVSEQALGTDSGDRLFQASIRISLATGLLALGIALALPILKIHRFWVYLVVMTLSVTGTLSVLGITQLKKEWQAISNLYETRYQQATGATGNSMALADVAAYKRLIDRNTSGLLDQWMARQVLEKNLALPELSSETEARAQAIANSRPRGQFQHSTVSIALSAGSALAALLLLWLAIRTVKFKRLVEALPTISSQGTSHGLCELKGMIEVDDQCPFIRDPLLDEKCIAFDYTVKEKRGSGKNARWKTIEHQKNAVPFWLEDNHGKIKIDPEGADFEYHKHHTETRGDRRYSVSFMDTFINVYCLGFAGLDQNQPDRLTIQQDSESPFLISAREESDILIDRGAKGFVGVAASLGLILFATTALLSADGSFSPDNLLTSALAVPMVLLGYIGILHYNDIVFLENRVKRARANIDTILQQRHDLWPNLEAIVKASMAHERDLQTAIAKLRAVNLKAVNTPEETDKLIAFEQTLKNKLVARVEDYPDMKNHDVMQQFMAIMTRTENYLSLLRNSYTDSAKIYNTRIQSFPDLILAKLFRFRPYDYFLTEKSIF
ncbi:LemA family protein [Marinobacter sp. CHS3-4]|uniref:LemA family protein n=1 Tax=Marinobacter sp. CHS3-4 TaxID=3045174 RepID=UPI0024B55680|nr:LemA family protein [Marinobacter sp. CHS3-4]MDI9244734.1 LemA family protein [Marinobacter sp. CHS3-4]